MRPPLWLDITLEPGTSSATVSLATCKNCGKPKATTTPCGFDHLAAVMEFAVFASGDYLASDGAE